MILLWVLRHWCIQFFMFPRNYKEVLILLNPWDTLILERGYEFTCFFLSMSLLLFCGWSFVTMASSASLTSPDLLYPHEQMFSNPVCVPDLMILIFDTNIQIQELGVHVRDCRNVSNYLLNDVPGLMSLTIHLSPQIYSRLSDKPCFSKNKSEPWILTNKSSNSFFSGCPSLQIVILIVQMLDDFWYNQNMPSYSKKQYVIVVINRTLGTRPAGFESWCQH